MFFERFKKKLNKKKVEISNKKYKYGLNFRKKFVWGIVGFNLLLLGAYYFYKNWTNGSRFTALISVLAIFFGLSFLYMIFEYTIAIDLNTREILYKKVQIQIDNIQKATLRHMLPPGMKSPKISIEIITKDKVKIIIPLIMHNNVEFTAIIRDILKDDFYIE